MGNYSTIISNSAPIMVAVVFEIFIENMNMHFATNKQMVAGIGMANILIHCVGGSLIIGFITGFTGVASRAFGAQNRDKYKRTFIQGLTNVLILLGLFVILAFFSYHIVTITGQSKQIAEYSYKTMISHLPGLCFFYISGFLWGFMNSQKVFIPVLVIEFVGIILHTTLSYTISKTYGFNGIIVSTNITFITLFVIVIIVASKYATWPLSFDIFDVQNPYQGYGSFVKQSFFVAAPYWLTLFIFQFMTLYLGSFKLNNQTAANVALTNLEGLMMAPHVGYSIYNFTRIGHFIGENQPNKIKQIVKQTLTVSQITYYLILLLCVIFRQKVASYYFTDHDVIKYFFFVLNFFLIRGFFQVIKMNGTYIARALGMGSQLVKISIIGYYLIGVISMIILCKYVFLEMKILGVWMGYFIGELFMVCIFVYKYMTIDIDSIVLTMHEQVRVKQVSDDNSA